MQNEVIPTCDILELWFSVHVGTVAATVCVAIIMICMHYNHDWKFGQVLLKSG